VPQKKIGFDAWAFRWLDGLELPANTVRSYRSTIAKAVRAFGGKPVRRLTVEDVKGFAAAMRDEGISDSTRGKHLRVLGACLQSAILDGYAGRNPVRELRPGERPRAPQERVRRKPGGDEEQGGPRCPPGARGRDAPRRVVG
jgi:site-specific recombinase XerD